MTCRRRRRAIEESHREEILTPIPKKSKQEAAPKPQSHYIYVVQKRLYRNSNGGQLGELYVIQGGQQGHHHNKINSSVDSRGVIKAVPTTTSNHRKGWSTMATTELTSINSGAAPKPRSRHIYMAQKISFRAHIFISLWTLGEGHLSIYAGNATSSNRSFFFVIDFFIDVGCLSDHNEMVQ